jgi:hypothetical protein
LATIPSVSLRSGTLLVSSPMSRGRWSRSLTGHRICGACRRGGTASSTRSRMNGGSPDRPSCPLAVARHIRPLSAVTFCSWHPVIAMVKRGPVRGPSHPCKQRNWGHRRHDPVVSVQLAHVVHGAVVLIIRRSWVRAPPAPPRLPGIINRLPPSVTHIETASGTRRTQNGRRCCPG